MDAQKRIVFIINPISGTLDKGVVIHLLDEILTDKQVQWEVKYTERPGHATEIADDAVNQEVDIVVAVGGDGTVNEVGRALVNTSTALGILPFGSGNGLARELRIPIDTRKAIGVLADGIIESIDYGKINTVPFFCTCGIGFDAFVSLKFAEAGKRGMLTYIEKALQEALNYKPETYELVTEDGSTHFKAFLIACGNASQYGNNAFIAPKAVITDGLLDVTVLQPFTLLDVPSLAIQLFNKTIDQNSHIKTLKCKSLKIHREKAGVVHFDGDPMLTEAELNIEVLQKKLRVVIPAENKKEPAVKSGDYFNMLKMMNEAIREDLIRRNKKIIDKNIELIKKMTKKE